MNVHSCHLILVQAASLLHTEYVALFLKIINKYRYNFLMADFNDFLEIKCGTDSKFISTNGETNNIGCPFIKFCGHDSAVF